ncbi:hypothetical protein LTR53_000463 [Teratosphaeriaceae sp. CCFEE 6253]|nr:hypothetical protein LTR53_000463 [Teratosphaeriaceae sp. CCFEE 6253]
MLYAKPAIVLKNLFATTISPALVPRPSCKANDEQDPGPEGETTAPFLPSREEGKGARRAEQQAHADEEEDVAHGQQGAIEEEDEAEEEEEEAWHVPVSTRVSRSRWGEVSGGVEHTYRRCRMLRRPLHHTVSMSEFMGKEGGLLYSVRLKAIESAFFWFNRVALASGTARARSFDSFVSGSLSEPSLGDTRS